MFFVLKRQPNALLNDALIKFLINKKDHCVRQRGKRIGEKSAKRTEANTCLSAHNCSSPEPAGTNYKFKHYSGFILTFSFSSQGFNSDVKPVSQNNRNASLYRKSCSKNWAMEHRRNPHMPILPTREL